MKTKFLFLAIYAISAVSLQNVYGQSTSKTDKVTLKIKLNPIQTLVVNGDKNVDLVYTTVDDYSSGVSVTKDDQLTIYSTGGFEIKTKSTGSQLTGNGGANIDANNIKITSSAGSKVIENAHYSTINLSADENMIVESSTGGVDKNVSIQYEASGENKFINYYKNGETPTVYQTEVVYTIYAK